METIMIVHAARLFSWKLLYCMYIKACNATLTYVLEVSRDKTIDLLYLIHLVTIV